MKHISRFISAAVILASAIVVSCNTNDIDSLQSRVDTLESQVSMLETSIGALNGNIEALSALAGGATINSVVEENGKYTITLTNGQVITINQGSVGVGYAPIMSVDADGYWKADYQDGKGVQFITDANGNKVSAKGADGITPMFSVDSQGYWTVSYDGGKTFTQIKDAFGNGVKAVASEDAKDSYFGDVTVSDDMLVLTLKNGDVYKVPVIKDFLVSIKNAETLQVFNAEEEKSYSVEMKGVASTVLSAPEGWSASLSENLLTVKAPVLTKATIADMSSDVSILAVSTQGFACVAKVHVQLDGASTGGTPTAAVTLGSYTYNTAEFIVTVENASSWTYLVQKSSEEAPSITKMITSGIAGSGTKITLTDLEEKTSYTVYVLPATGDKFGAIASASVTTPAEPVQTYEDNYTAYNEGKAIFIAGKKYTKAEFGEPILVKASAANTDLKATLTTGGVIFLEEEAGCNFALTENVTMSKRIVLISRYESKPATLKIVSGQVLTYNASTSGTVFKDIIFDSKAHNNYLFNVYTNAGGDFHFDGCEFYHVASKPLFYSSNAAHRFPKSIRFYNCYFEISGTAGGRIDYISLGNQVNLHADDIEEMTFHNNIFNAITAGGNQGLTLFGYGYSSNAAVPMNLSFTFTNNTMYELRGSNNMFQFNSLKNVTIKNNLFWSNGGLNSYIVRVGVNAADPNPVDVSDNIAYGKPVILFNTGGKFKLTSGNNALVVEDDPLADADPSKKDFEPIAKYKSYGAQR